ncbi:hypothetical protein CBOVI_01655 [Corynebacterium bovis DSM 20582 = CIP 54.80]|nr:hypothetical protein CBOVI_01655 [Corynebacterium bovis DSM 20582 = CIP 54.80]
MQSSQVTTLPLRPARVPVVPGRRVGRPAGRRRHGAGPTSGRRRDGAGVAPGSGQASIPKALMRPSRAESSAGPGSRSWTATNAACTSVGVAGVVPVSTR